MGGGLPLNGAAGLQNHGYRIIRNGAGRWEELTGGLIMLRLIADDISDRKRWHRICETCEDFGVRVQLSLFECWLDDATFQAFWTRLEELIEPKEDRLVAYTLDAGATGKRRTAGQTMVCTQPCQYYVL